MDKKKSLIVLLVLAVLGTGYHFVWSDDPEDAGTEASAEDSGGLEIPLFHELDKENSTVVEHTGYTLSYNSKNRTPNWVAYELLASEITNATAERRETFTTDPMIKGRQAYDSDYVGSGYDRGHMAPAGDMKWSSDAMEECFYLSNICPQSHDLNSGAWNDLEKQVRYEARYYGKVWVVCGPVFESGKSDMIGANKVRVPDSFFKALLAVNKKGEYISVAFVFPNEACVRNLSLYAMSVDEVEDMLGADLFYNLEDDVEDRTESTFNLYRDWRIKDAILED